MFGDVVVWQVGNSPFETQRTKAFTISVDSFMATVPRGSCVDDYFWHHCHFANKSSRPFMSVKSNGMIYRQINERNLSVRWGAYDEITSMKKADEYDGTDGNYAMN